MTKPANHYASTTPIPDWLEAEIKSLDDDATANFIRDLGLTLWYGEWDNQLTSKGFTDRAYEWLGTQDRDGFKGLLQWVAMELI